MKKFILSLFIVLFLIGTYETVFGMTYYENTDFVTGIVTATALNVRCGPGKTFKSIGMIYKNQYVRVFAKVGDWYVIQSENDLIGTVSKEYIRKVPASNNNTNNANTSSNNNSQNTTNTTNTTNNNTNNVVSITDEEKELFELINKQRNAYGLSSLKIDPELQKIAKLKAQDLVNNNYFSHNSPTYGSPFDMMKKYGITYKAAGENIAGNSTLNGAVTSWMNSQGHRENILSNAFNYTGIGVVNSPKYGKVMVQMFIGR